MKIFFGKCICTCIILLKIKMTETIHKMLHARKNVTHIIIFKCFMSFSVCKKVWQINNTFFYIRPQKINIQILILICNMDFIFYLKRHSDVNLCWNKCKLFVRFGTHFFGIAISLIKTILNKNPGIFSLHSEFKVVGTLVGPNYELSAVSLDPWHHRYLILQLL